MLSANQLDTCDAGWHRLVNMTLTSSRSDFLPNYPNVWNWCEKNSAFLRYRGPAQQPISASRKKTVSPFHAVPIVSFQTSKLKGATVWLAAQAARTTLVRSSARHDGKDPARPVLGAPSVLRGEARLPRVPLPSEMTLRFREVPTPSHGLGHCVTVTCAMHEGEVTERK